MGLVRLVVMFIFCSVLLQSSMAANNLHLWNSLLCPPLGFGLNLLLLWLILRRTPKEMVVHSRVLLQTCLVDFMLLGLQTVCQTVIVYEQFDKAVCFFDGYVVRLLGHDCFQPPVLFTVGMIWFICACANVFGIGVQFAYRFVVLNRNQRVNVCQYFSCLFGIFLLTCLCTLGFVVGCSSTLNKSTINREHYAGFIDFGQNPYFLTIIIEGVALISYGLTSTMCAIAHVITFVCGWKMIRFVRDHATFNPRMKELNRQLTRNLIFLAGIPLLLEMESTMQLVHLQFQIGNLEMIFYGFLVFHWLPVLNPVVSILTNRPYREAIFKGKLSRKLFCSSTTTTVTPANENVQ